MRRLDCESVTEREELVGRFSVASRFPQYLWWGFSFGGVEMRGGEGGEERYLMTAMFTGAVVLARYIFVSAMVAIESMT